ncbi:pseudouridine synthase [Haloferula sp. A504]|uniref:RluA family pseudouridine synthase n=1 Tax=Haloferula sp. A504 TaxID=3373601 RepID=UPI0031C4B453|nr:RluA family pseudouridine synthase [Verrucomicrobiaceae bacterium E54]
MADQLGTVRQRHIVPGGVADVRLSDYVAGPFEPSIASRKGLKKAIKRGEFRVDGTPATTGTWVKPGQKIELLFGREPVGKEFRLKLEVPFEDDHLAVIHKPAGFPVSGNRFRTIANALPFNLTESREDDRLVAPRPVHRLDRQTSGLLIAAKTHRAQTHLGKLFEEKQVRKRYRAIVIGRLEGSGRLESDIGGKAALSRYRAVAPTRSLHNQWLTRVDLFPETGRTHQLRIHMAERGHPILGDPLYGKEGFILRGRGLFLCAVALGFPHPVSGESLHLEIDDPGKFDQTAGWEERRWERAQR